MANIPQSLDSNGAFRHDLRLGQSLCPLIFAILRSLTGGFDVSLSSFYRSMRKTARWTLGGVCLHTVCLHTAWPALLRVCIILVLSSTATQGVQ